MQKIRKAYFYYYFFFRRSRFPSASGENEAESAIFLSWFSVFDSADGALLWDKMDVSTWLSLSAFLKSFVGIAGLLFLQLLFEAHCKAI